MEKTKVTLNFMNIKMKEYEELKKELETKSKNKMWVVAKYNSKGLEILKELSCKLNKEVEYYHPKN